MGLGGTPDVTKHGPTVAVIQARMTSTRLPGKVLLPLAGTPILAHVVARARATAGIDKVVVAIPDGAAHEPVAALCTTLRAPVTRGPEQDVLKRTLIAAEAQGAGTVVRLTSDCPFLDPRASAAIVAAFHASGLPYASNAMESGYPLGFDTQVMTIASLREADAEASDPYEREHVTPFLWRRPDRYAALYLDHHPNLRHWRLVVDTKDDYEMASRVYDELASHNPLFGLDALRTLFAARPDLPALNAGVRQTPYEGLPRA